MTANLRPTDTDTESDEATLGVASRRKVFVVPRAAAALSPESSRNRTTLQDAYGTAASAASESSGDNSTESDDSD